MDYETVYVATDAQKIISLFGKFRFHDRKGDPVLEFQSVGKKNRCFAISPWKEAQCVESEAVYCVALIRYLINMKTNSGGVRKKYCENVGR